MAICTVRAVIYIDCDFFVFIGVQVEMHGAIVAGKLSSSDRHDDTSTLPFCELFTLG